MNFGEVVNLIESVTDTMKWEHATSKNHLKLYDKYEPHFSANIKFYKGDVYIAKTISNIYIGFIQVDNTGLIENIIVNYKHQGKGYGKILLEKAISLGGYRLFVGINNVRAQNLYKKYKFKIVGETDNGYYEMKI